MQEIPALITDLTIILVVAALTTLLCKKINLPSVLGYILAGFLAGPVVQFLPTIEDLGSIEVWSDIGVIFLMFGLGLEFSVHKMAEVGVPGFLSAGVQAVGMGAVGVLVGLALGWGTMNSVFLGVMLAMSSTMITMKSIEDLGLKKEPFANLAMGTLVIEDIIAIFAMVILSTIAVSQSISGFALAERIGLLLLYLALWLILGIYLVPTVMKKLVGLMNDEVLLVFSLGLCFLMAVLAEEIGGDENEFVGMMNARAFELGMRDTVFKNCAGYDAQGQYSTAYDTALLTRELLKHDFLKSYMTSWMDSVRNGQTELVNENRLVRTYEGILGVKAGHSEESGYTLSLAAERDGQVYISVVMGCSDKDERFAVGKSLLAAGFSSYKVTTPAFSNEFLKPLSVHHGVDDAVEIEAEDLTGLVVPKSGDELSSVIFIPEYVEAPVKKGQKIGTVGFYNGDALLYETNLIASESVECMTFSIALKKYLYIMYK